MSKVDTNTLIKNLTDDLQETKRMISPFKTALGYILFTLGYVTFCLSFLKLRSDWLSQLQNPYFLIDVFLMSLISLSSLIALAWLRIPGMQTKRLLIPFPFIFSGLFVGWSFFKAFTLNAPSFSLFMNHCLPDGFFLGFIPILLLLFFTRKGFTTAPFETALMSALGVGGFGYIGLRLSCAMDTIGHGTLYHLIPFIVFGVFISLFARKLFQW